jgi:hypothetical protein
MAPVRDVCPAGSPTGGRAATGTITTVVDVPASGALFPLGCLDRSGCGPGGGLQDSAIRSPGRHRPASRAPSPGLRRGAIAHACQQLHSRHGSSGRFPVRRRIGRTSPSRVALDSYELPVESPLAPRELQQRVREERKIQRPPQAQSVYGKSPNTTTTRGALSRVSQPQQNRLVDPCPAAREAAVRQLSVLSRGGFNKSTDPSTERGRGS